ncbi:hypothetical protein [Kocuria sp.]|uniref:hypothetical protein n=1 Tax=Kocuria sp. TaxID=1871328 RepID=UPI0026DBD4DF|nr:hypothetical protein [Kocuria sp.]MDO4918755.1 hypothetical protein [Kocuria sp.]
MGLSWVSSSLVLAVVVVLCALWFVPRMARRCDAPVQAQVDAPDLQLHSALHTTPHERPSPSRVVSDDPPPLHERETTAMDTTAPAPTALPVQQGSLAGLRIRWDRTIVFAAGLLMLAAALLTALAAPFTAVTWAVPVVLLLLGAGCVAGLRYLAVTDRAQRGAVRTSARPTTAAPQHAIFDNEDEARQELAAQQQESSAVVAPAEEAEQKSGQPSRPVVEPTYTVAELRAMALKVAGSETAGASTWQPVPVPKPLYTEAPVVHRSAPEPLRVPERPAARTTTLKDAVRAGERESAALNLDDVLKRRRA